MQVPLRSNLPSQARAAEARSLRVRYWYRGAKLRLGLKSNHSFGRLIEPENAWFNDDTGVRTFSNKYAAYDKGLRLPWRRLVEKVDTAQNGDRDGSGSRRDIEHLLFAILAQGAPSTREIRTWLRWFSIHMRMLVFVPGRCDPQPLPEWLSQFGDFQWERLDSAPPLDALALTTFVAEQASQLGRPDIASRAERWACISLHRLAPDLQERDLWQAMLAFYKSWIPACCM